MPKAKSIPTKSSTASLQDFVKRAVALKRSFVSRLLIAVVLSMSTGRAWGHAIIVESTPSVNGVITSPSLDIKLRFNSRIDGRRSKLTLISPDRVSHAITPLQQTSADSLLAKVSDLLPGAYQLRWQVLATDGHITQGSIPFRVVSP